jgi:transposase-like protein
MDIKEIYRLFPTEADCIAYLESICWKGMPTCPYCDSRQATPIRKQNRYHCNACNTAYSVTVNTIFHHSHLSLHKWFLAIWLILESRTSISTRQLASALEVNKNSAWRLTNEIRRAMIESPAQREMIQSIVDFDKMDTKAMVSKGKRRQKRH